MLSGKYVLWNWIWGTVSKNWKLEWCCYQIYKECTFIPMLWQGWYMYLSLNMYMCYSDRRGTIKTRFSSCMEFEIFDCGFINLWLLTSSVTCLLNKQLISDCDAGKWLIIILFHGKLVRPKLGTFRTSYATPAMVVVVNMFNILGTYHISSLWYSLVLWS